MKLHITISSRDEACTTDPRGEAVTILRSIAQAIRVDGKNGGPIFDTNGNRAGKWELDTELGDTEQ